LARWLGIDVTEAWVRVALVRSTLRRPQLLALREERVVDHGTPSAALRAATVGLRVDAAACAVSGARCFVRRVELPAAAQKELGDVLSHEVEATLPLELEDAVMDHRVLRAPAGVDQPGMLPILAAVAPTGEVRDAIHLVRRGLGQEPQRVGLGPLPLANLSLIAPELAGAEPVALLDLGEAHAELVILLGGEPRFVRSLTRGTAGLPGEAHALGRELRQSFSAWRAQGVAPVARLHVVGGGAETPGLHPFLAAEAGTAPTALPRLALDGVGETDAEQLGRCAKALGLALGLGRRAVDLNLRQGPLEAQRSYQFLGEKAPLFAGLGAAIVVSFGFTIFAEMRALGRERTALEAELAGATKAYLGAETSDPKAAAEQLDAILGGKGADPMPAVDGFGVLVELSERLPAEIKHEIAELAYNRGDVVLKGMVPTVADAHTVAAKLDEHDCFHNVNISRTDQLKSNRPGEEPKEQQKYVLEFSVKCDVKKAKKGPKAAASAEPARGGGP
jgi:general secretion pathway protein L